ncbi:14959_t:CDS:2 [Racocetra fulgida]|uniref:14959_t:CDS:1 n=1 Tax=Racocetra fulgida TaxID=60492 RepID=A0A9N8VVC7_9GLOM|nr:14959_t:CDS:2 [Racocetra fulgida]
MTYEITPQDFCAIVRNPRCQGKEVENGLAKEGHPHCGECNYGGQHKMGDDLRQINQNFRAFDVLVKKQAKISQAKNEKDFNEAKNKLLSSFQELKKKCEDEAGTGFFYGSCIGLDGNKGDFSERIKSTFRRLAKELGYYIGKEEKDPVKKARLFAALSQKNQAIKSLQVELRKDPVYDLFSAEKSEELSNIVRNIFQSKPNTSFFTWKRKEEEETEKVSESKKYLGFISQEAGKNTLLITGGLLGLLLVW